MKIGFIGVGNMAKAIIAGLVTAKVVKSEDIVIHSAHPTNYQNFSKIMNLTAVDSNIEVTQKADIIFLAVKPDQIGSVEEEISPGLTSEKVVVSMAAGLDLTNLAKKLAPGQAIIRILPNINVENLVGMTAFAANDQTSTQQAKSVQELLEKIGQVIELPENEFTTFSAIAGSGPAFVYLFIDALSRAGVKHGIKKSDATMIAAQTVLGSAQNLLKSEKTPWDLIDQVASPGGTTVQGLLKMEELGLMSATIAGIDATIDKDQEISGND